MLEELGIWGSASADVLTTLWLRCGLVAVCGLWAARVVRPRGAKWSAMILRATWLGVVLCAALSWSSLSSRALWKVTLPTASFAMLETAPPINETLRATAPTTNDATSSTRSDFAPNEVAPNPTSNVAAETLAPSEVAPTMKAPRTSPFFGVLGVLWCIGSAFLLLRLGVCVLQMRRVVRMSTHIEDDSWRDVLRELCGLLRLREPRLLQSEQAESPFLTGLIRPCIVLPRGDFSTSRRFVLLHELTHLQRRDLWWNVASRVLCALLWTQPLLWVLARATERVGEEVCDEAVIEHIESPRQYAQCLLDLAESWRPSRGERTVGASVVPLRSSLARRVQNILDERRQTMTISRRASWTMGALMLCVVGASLSLVAVQSNAETQTSSTRSASARVDLSSPESAVQSFVRAINGKSLDTAALCVEGSAPLVNRALKERLLTVATTIAISDLNTQRDGNSAQVSFYQTTVTRLPGKSRRAQTSRQTVPLKLIGKKWKINTRTQAISSPFSGSVFELARLLLPPDLDEVKAWAKGRGKAEIVGRVVREDGKPAANVFLNVQNLDSIATATFQSQTFSMIARDSALSNLKDLLLQSTNTDANGNFRVRGLTTARYRITARLDERLWLKDGVSVPEMVAVNEPKVTAREGSSTRSPDIALTRGGLLKVQVVDDSSEKPLPKVFVFAQTWRSSNASSPTIASANDVQGRVNFRLVPGRVRVSLLSSYDAKRRRGLIATNNGKPYDYESVSILADGKTAPIRFDTATVTVLKDQTTNIQIRLKPYVAPIPTPTPPIQPLTRADGVMTGRVVYENGKPAASVRVVAAMQKTARWEVLRSIRLDNGDFSEPASAKRWSSVRGRVEQATTTRQDGTFRFNGLTTAPYDIFIVDKDARGFVEAVPEWVAVAVQGAWARDGQTVRRAKPLVLTRGAIVQGRVLDSNNLQPVGGVVLSYEGSQNPSTNESAFVFIRTDANGFFKARVTAGISRFYVAGPSISNGSFIFADTRKRAASVYRIRTNRGAYGVGDKVRYILDNGKSQTTRSWGDHIAIESRSGQTRNLTIFLRRLMPAPETP